MYRPGRTMITPEKVIAVLNDAGIRFVLMGTHGIGGWRSEARATDDIDFLIQKRYHRKAIRAIQHAFPHLEVKEQKFVTRFLDPKTRIVVVDLMKPGERFHQEVFRNTVPAGRTHHVPDLEMALVCKFAAMISPHRLVKKRAVDAGDFMDIVDEHGEIIDFRKLRRLADLVCSGGGDRIEKFIEDAKAGRLPKF
jgi:hypothetical protein